MPASHRKPKKERKEEEIRVRVTAEQKKLFIKAAELEGLDISAWIRQIALREAKKSQPTE
jgi:uncharacterized protein (DUF1778 family)